MEATSERKQHHGIRTLSVGAVSVLLGTTLWISIPTSTVHADEINIDDNQPKTNLESNESASTDHVEKVIVEQNQSSSEGAQQDINAANDVSAQNDQKSVNKINDEIIKNENVDADIKTNTDNSHAETSYGQTESQEIIENKQKTDVEKNKTQTTDNITPVEQTGNSSENTSTNVTTQSPVDNSTNNDVNVNNSNLADTQAELIDSNTQFYESSPLIDQIGQQGKTTVNSSNNTSSKLNIDDLSPDLSDEVLKANLTQGNQILLNQSNSSDTMAGKNADPTKQLEAMARTATLVAASPNADNYTTVNNYNDLQRAVSNYSVSGVNIDGDIYVFGNLTINRAFTIKGTNNAKLNLNQNAIINNSTLTLEDITVNGSIMGNGTVNIKGDVISNVNESNGYTLTNSEKATPGVKVNWTQTKGYNIQSSTVNVDDNASLTINRSSVGDGIHLLSNGIVNVGNYSQLTINMNTNNELGTGATVRYHDAGIFAESNGSFTTGYKSVVTLNTSIGQGIAMTGLRPNVTDNDRFGGYTRDRANGAGQINLGQYSTLNFTGRDGVILGNNSNFNVGEYANVHFENKGRGVALDLANNSNINIADHAVTYFHSVGKNTTNAIGVVVGPSGSYEGYNYIGVNEAGNITIGEDATFRVIMENRGDNAWDDVISLDSQLATTNAAFTSKKGAIIDIRDDNTNFYAELISFPLGAANSRIDIQDPLLLNLQRYSAGGETTGWMAGVGGVAINSTSEKYTANLIYMGGTKGVLSIGGTNYVVYQQIKSDGAQQIWTDVDSVEFHKNGFASQDIFNNGANSDVSISGNGFTSGIRANQIRDNQTDPTLVNLQNSPAYGISTMRASHQIWIPHETSTQIKGTHTNTISYVYEDGTPVMGADSQPLVVTQNLNLARDLTLDLTSEQIKTIQDYALGHTADETLNYIRSGYSVTQDSGWTYTNDQGQKVTDPYASVTSPVKEGYIITIQSTNAPGVTLGADGQTVKANFVFDAANDVVQNGQLSAGYRNQGITGIPDNYQTIVVYKKAEKGSVQVIFYDDTTNDAIPSVGFNSGTEEAGTPVTYTTAQNISDLEKQGYVYVSTDGVIPTTIPNNATLITVHMKHGTNPVNPDQPTDKYTKEDLQKTVTRTINYIDTAGNIIADSVTSTVVFTGSGTIDTVTGNLVTVDASGNIVDQNGQLTWTYSVDGDSAQSGNSYTFAETAAKPSIDYNGSTYNFVSVTPGNYSAGNGSVTSYEVNTNNSHDLTVDVIYNEGATYHTGKTDTKNVTRIINYLDGKTDEKIPINLILANPVEQTVSMYRTEILDSTGKVIGYGTVSQDGKMYTLNNNWIIDGIWESVNSPDLTTNGYKAPRFEDSSLAAIVAEYIVNADTKNATVNVYYDHQVIPIGPDTPDKHGVDINQVEKVVKETVHYVGAGDKTPADQVQTSKWIRTVTVDVVTNEVVPDGEFTTDWTIPSDEKSTYDQVDTPVVNGYYADQANVPATAVTQNDIEKTITYKQIGKVIPVDPSGNQIPGIDTPHFPNDPNDPTKVIPGEKPYVPGYHPETGKPGDAVDPAPGDPSKDVEVPYTPETPIVDQKAVVNYIDSDEENKVITSSGDLIGKPGEQIDYTTIPTITDLTNKGYVLIYDGFPTRVTFDDDDGITQIFTVVLKHGTQTVTPEKPGIPGDPINPNDPDGPKWSDETGKDSLIKTGTQTIHYEGAGSKTPTDNVQNFEFTRTAVIDKVTGEVISTSGWNVTSYTFGNVDTPIVEGYHADKRNAGGTTITPDDLNKMLVVRYTPNGKIIPVDPAGNPIPNVPTPQYPTDPTDPTKVVPDEPVPAIPGYRPSTPIVTPTDPDKDTPVPYAPIQGSIQVIFHDDTSNQTIPDVGYNSGVQDEGTRIDYTTNKNITDLINKGYVYVGTDGNVPAEIVADQNITITVHMKHGTTTITPDQPGKPGEPINPNDPNGPKWPSDTDTKGLTKQGNQTIHYVYVDGNKAADDNVQNVTFVHTLVFDNVTGQVIDDRGWTPESHKFNNVFSPTIDGHHADKIVVDGVTVTVDNPTSETTVVYAKNGQVIREQQEVKASQIVKYVDDEGNELHKSELQEFTFTYTGDAYDEVTGAKVQTGTWNAISTDFPVVDVPVITGYVAVSGYTNNNGKYMAGGFTTTRESSEDQRNRVFTVLYKKVGNIVPVGPDGTTPIPDAPTPSYKNDPTNPTKVIPDEPVPKVPGYTPNTPTVTPGDPTTDTLVPYTPGNPITDQKAVVNYIDADEGNKVIISSGNLIGKAGDKVDYNTSDTIKNLENKGYVLVHNGFPDGVTFDNDDSTIQTYTVILKHGTTIVIPDKPGKPGEPINPNDPDGPKWPDTTGKDNLSKTGTQTIHYTGAGNNTPKDNVQSFTFTRTAVVDNVTGKVISTGAWNVTSHTFGNVDTPVVEGYHADKRTAGNTTITPEDLNKIVTVNYTANGKIIPVDPNGKPIPNVPTPTYPTDPNDPTKVVPNEPVPTIPGYKPSVPTVTPSDPGKDTPVPYAPQTTPVTPNIPVTPNEPSTPTTPDTSAPTPHGEDVPVTPNEPDTPAPAPHGEKPEEPDRPAPAPHAPKAPTAKGNNTPEKEDKTVPTAAAVVKNEQTPEAELPQTGEKNDSAAAILGATAGMIGLIGLSGVKKKKS